MNEILRTWFDRQSWRELTRVSIDDPPHTPYRAAATLLAVLAFPDDTGRRERLMKAIRAYLRIRLNRRHEMRRRDIERALQRGRRLFDVRLRAGRIAQQVLAEASSSGMNIKAARSIREAISREGAPITVELPIGVLPADIRSKLDRRALQPRAPRPGADFNKTNVFRDVWSPSIPVLPLALALCSKNIFDHSLPSFEDLIIQPHWSRKAIDILPLMSMALYKKGIVKPEKIIMLRPL